MLANLVGGVYVEAISGSQLLDQLPAKLGLLSLFSLADFKLSKPITSTTDHQVVKLHPLSSPTKRIERLAHTGSLGDRMTRMTGGHSTSVAPGAAPPLAVLENGDGGTAMVRKVLEISRGP
jgi:hypothetical protein